jgi:hypothetical protein
MKATAGAGEIGYYRSSYAHQLTGQEKKKYFHYVIALTSFIEVVPNHIKKHFLTMTFSDLSDLSDLFPESRVRGIFVRSF